MNETGIFILITCLGMLIQSVVGFAGSLFAIPLLALILSPRDAVPTYAVVMLVVNVLLVFETRQAIDWRRAGWLMLGGVVATPIGAYALKMLPTDILRVAISLITLTFGVLFIGKIIPRLTDRRGTYLGVGFISGLLGGSISESGPPVVVLGMAQGWSKEMFRATLLAYFLVLSLVASLSFFSLGLLTTRHAMTAAVAIMPTSLAAYLGVLVKNRMSEQVFQRAVLVIILLVGLIGLIPHAH